MRLVMTGAVVARCALLRIRRVHFNAVVEHAIATCVMQVAIMKIVRVVVMLYSRVAAIWSMQVAVRTGMLLASLRHWLVLSQCGPWQAHTNGRVALMALIPNLDIVIH
jgi:hypothetical protein